MAEEIDHSDVAALLSNAYSASAIAYKELWAPLIHRLSQLLLKDLPLAQAARVADVGAGVGTLLPDLRMAAPSAEVIGADLSLGMILEAPDDFPRAVMDAARLAFEKHSFDVIILAFVLFHLPEPILALKEAARVLRGGGSIGTLTWGTVPGYPALEIWNETLDAAEAAPMDGLSRHYLVDSPEKMRAMLELADFVSVKTWTRRFEHRQSLEEFLAHRTGHGASRRRLDSLPARVQKTCIETARSRLIELTPEDFTDRSDVVYTVAATPGKH